MAVYFIQAVDGGPIKIGSSGNPDMRLSDLQVANPKVLRILATMPGGTPQEWALHEQFKKYRVQGEWFTPAPEIMALIKYHSPKPARSSKPKIPTELANLANSLRLAFDMNVSIRECGKSINQISAEMGSSGVYLRSALSGDPAFDHRITIELLHDFVQATGRELEIVINPKNPLNHPSCAHLRGAA